MCIFVSMPERVSQRGSRRRPARQKFSKESSIVTLHSKYTRTLTFGTPHKCYWTFLSADGTEIRVGRGAKDNDELTMKERDNKDWYVSINDKSINQ